MVTKKILIFGASGQVGRHCIRRLVRNNYKITAVTRNLHQKGYILKTQAPIGYLDVVQANIYEEEKLDELLSNVDICINLIGILFEKNKLNSFDNIHSNFPKRLAEICGEMQFGACDEGRGGRQIPCVERPSTDLCHSWQEGCSCNRRVGCLQNKE